MEIKIEEGALIVSEVKELGQANSCEFRDNIRDALLSNTRTITILLEETIFVDACGLGALVSLHKTMCERNGVIQLVNPRPPVQKILELTRLYRIFNIVHSKTD